jgi:hypothetical protein
MAASPSPLDDCPDCPEPPSLMDDGLCYWQGCEVKASDVIYADGVIHKGAFIPVGNVELCAGHLRRLQRLGRLDLKWSVVDAAFRRQLTTGGML